MTVTPQEKTEKIRSELAIIANVERAIQLVSELGLSTEKTTELKGKLETYLKTLQEALP